MDCIVIYKNVQAVLCIGPGADTSGLPVIDFWSFAMFYGGHHPLVSYGGTFVALVAFFLIDD